MEHIDRRMLMAGMILLPVTARAARLGSGAEQAGLDALVRKWANEQGFRGLVALGRKGHATASSAQGFANVEMRLPFDLDVPMAIASISKRITAVAVMRLVERGQLALDTPIARYLPAYRKDIGAQVTLRHLLSNSSGIPNQFGAVVRARPELFGKDMPAGEAVSLFASGDLVFAPGTRFDYALTNWILVLAILETVSGARFPDLVEQLGDSMSYRTLDPPTVWASPTADYLAAGGGFCGTGRDLMRFAHRVYGTSFLTADSRHALTTIEVASDHYALGGRVREVTIAGKAVRCAWDTGNRAGYRSVLGHRLDGKGTVVVLNNTGYSQKTMDEVAEAALRLQAG